MEMAVLKKHPFLWTVYLWIFLFLSFGCFRIDGVTAISYLAAMVMAGTAVYLPMRRKEHIRKIPKDKQKALLYMLGGVGYAGAMMYTFAHVRSNPAINARNELVPFVFLTAGVIGYCICMSIRKKWSYRRIIFVMIVFSSIMHFFLMLAAQFNLAQWDMGNFFFDGHGHAGYIEYLYNHNFIPAQFDPREKWQYYHPPLNHLIQALLLRIQTLCGVELNIAVRNTQYPTLLYVMITTVCSYLIFKEFKLKKKALVCAEAVMAFAPALMYVGLFINNDMLSIMFVFLTILYTLRWYRKPAAKNILKIALCFGLGMFSKMSAALIAPAVAVIFLYVLFRPLKEKNYRTFGRYFGQMCAFMGIAAPLSLYWSLRNLIRFGVPLGYVPQSLEKLQYIPDPPIVRLLDFNPVQLLNPYFNDIEYGDAFNEYNPLIALLKSSASDVGVMRFSLGEWAGYITFWTTLAVALTAFGLMIWVLFRRKSMNRLYKIFFGVMYGVYLYSFESFCIKYPYTCTEQIRYAMPLILIGALFIGWGISQLAVTKSRISRILLYSTSMVVFLFCLASLITFTAYGSYHIVGMML